MNRGALPSILATKQRNMHWIKYVMELNIIITSNLKFSYFFFLRHFNFQLTSLKKPKILSFLQNFLTKKL